MKTTNYEQDADLYSRARDGAVDAWRIAHRQEFDKMMTGVMADYRGEDGGFERRYNHCVRLVAEAAGFPSLAVWVNRRESLPNEAAA